MPINTSLTKTNLARVVMLGSFVIAGNYAMEWPAHDKTQVAILAAVGLAVSYMSF